MSTPHIAFPGHLPIHFTKHELVALAAQHAKAIHDHPQIDLIKTYLELKRYQLYFEALLQELEPLTAREMGSHGLKQFDSGSLRLKHYFKVRYDFGSDPVIREIQELLAQTKQALKDRKAELLQLDLEGQQQENPFTGLSFQARKPMSQGVDTVILQQTS